MVGFRVLGLCVGGALALSLSAPDANAEYIWDFSLEGEVVHADEIAVERWGADVGDPAFVSATFTSDSDTLGDEEFVFGSPVGNDLRFEIGQVSFDADATLFDIDLGDIIENFGVERWLDEFAPRMIFVDGAFSHIDIGIFDTRFIPFLVFEAGPGNLAIFDEDGNLIVDGLDFRTFDDLMYPTQSLGGVWDEDTVTLTAERVVDVPIPATAALFGFGMLLLSFAAWRSRAR